MAVAKDKAVATVRDAGSLDEWKGYQPEQEWESDGTEDYRPSFPVIKLVQGVSTMADAEKHIGQFWHSDTEKFDEFLDVVPLVVRQTRSLFPTVGDQPLCLSVDGRVPLDNQPLWAKDKAVVGPAPGQEWDVPAHPGTCAECVFSMWGEDGSPPPCASAVSTMVLREDGTAAQLRVGGMSIRPLRQFITKKCKPSRIPLFGFRLRLSSVRKAEEGRIWQELVIDPTLLSPKVAEAHSAILRDQRLAFEESVRRESEGVVEEKSDDGWMNAEQFDEAMSQRKQGDNLDLPFE